MKNIVIAIALAFASVASASDLPTPNSQAIMADVTGTTITATQIIAVRDYEQSVADDPASDETTVQVAIGWVTICNKALDGNQKDLNKVAPRYNELVTDGTIQPVA